MFRIRSQSNIEDLKNNVNTVIDPVEERRKLKIQVGNYVSSGDGQTYVVTQVGMKYLKAYKLDSDPTNELTLKISEVFKVPKPREDVIKELEESVSD